MGPGGRWGFSAGFLGRAAALPGDATGVGAGAVADRAAGVGEGEGAAGRACVGATSPGSNSGSKRENSRSSLAGAGPGAGRRSGAAARSGGASMGTSSPRSMRATGMKFVALAWNDTASGLASGSGMSAKRSAGGS
jgi:hypothetical protein